VLIDPATVDLGSPIQVGNVIGSEETCQKISNQTANTVNGENIKSIVDVKQELELGGIIASNASDNAEDHSSPGGNETTARSDGDKSSNDTATEPDSRPFAFETVVEDAPSETPDAGGKVGDDRCHDGTEVSGQGGTSIEPEPTNPEENSADNNLSDVVRTVVELVSPMAATFSEHQGIGKRSGTGGKCGLAYHRRNRDHPS